MSNDKITRSVNWADMRKQAGYTLAEASKASGYSVAAINGLEKRNEGSQRLREQLYGLYMKEAPQPRPTLFSGEESHQKSSVFTRLDRVRIEKGLTWDALADRLDCNRSFFFRLKSGERNIGPKLLHRLEQLESESHVQWPGVDAIISSMRTEAYQLQAIAEQLIADADRLEALKKTGLSDTA